MKTLNFEALIDRNEQQEMIVYRFFSSEYNQLSVVLIFMFMYTESESISTQYKNSHIATIIYKKSLNIPYLQLYEKLI